MKHIRLLAGFVSALLLGMFVWAATVDAAGADTMSIPADHAIVVAQASPAPAATPAPSQNTAAAPAAQAQPAPAAAAAGAG